MKLLDKILKGRLRLKKGTFPTVRKRFPEIRAEVINDFGILWWPQFHRRAWLLFADIVGSCLFFVLLTFYAIMEESP